MKVTKFVPLTFVIAAIGCGPGQGDLQGTVSYKGKNLAVGTITAFGGDGMPKTAPINEDGTYQMKGIGAGEIKVVVTSLNPAEVQVAVRKKEAPPPPPKGNPNWFPIPQDYSDPEKSGLTFQLKRGANAWDIELK